MFKIEIRLSDFTSLSGCESLDFRRRFSLPDCTRSRKADYLSQGSLYAAVPESFARSHFTPSACTESAFVPLSACVPGDVAAREDYGPGVVALNANLPDERIVALFLAGRAASQRAEIARLTAEVARLEALLPEDAE
jgi:hypothetical protein